MTEADVKLFKSRETVEEKVPKSAYRLFWSNDDVDKYNETRIGNAKGTTVMSQAWDRVDGKHSKIVKNRTLAALKKLKRSQTYGLSAELNLKVGIRYMITINIDIEDGLVNGACGVLKDIEFDKNDKKQPKTLFIDFNSDRIGVKARNAYQHNPKDKKDRKDWVKMW